MAKPDFSFAAGPVTVSPVTLAALGSPVTYHYDPDFLDAFRRTERMLASIFKTTNDVVMLQGEATLGLEAAAKSLVRPGMPVLNLVQGIFGKGMGTWLRTCGAVLHEIEVPYDQAVDPDSVARYLDEHPEIQVLTVVASETPSGTICDMSRIGPICDERGVVTLVDTVSGLGSMPWHTDEWGLDVCVAGAQKCLGGPPGVALLTVSDRAWTMMTANEHAPTGSYLSLLDWKQKWLGDGRFPYTPSVVDVRGVEAACAEVLEEGIDAVVDRHVAAAAVARAGVLAMGLRPWPASEDIAAHCVTTIQVPEQIDPVRLHGLVRTRYSVMLPFSRGVGRIIQLGHMGPTARGLYPMVGLAAIGRALIDLGHPLDVGAGVSAALSVLSEQLSD